MADKTDSDNLLTTLTHLLLEHRAMGILLRQDDTGLIADVIRLTKSPAVRKGVRSELDGLAAALRSVQLDERGAALLSAVLERALVLKGVKPL